MLRFGYADDSPFFHWREMTPETHYQPQGAAQGPKVLRCPVDGREFAVRRKWTKFCSTACRNAFHAAQRREEKMREAAGDLYDALLGMVNAVDGVPVGPAWEPITAQARAALHKAGYREPRQA